MITWTRSRKNLPISRHVIAGNKLTIKNTTDDDGGAYLCQGTNELGSVVAVTWIFVNDAGKKEAEHDFFVGVYKTAAVVIFLFVSLSESLHCGESSQ